MTHFSCPVVHTLYACSLGSRVQAVKNIAARRTGLDDDMFILGDLNCTQNLARKGCPVDQLFRIVSNGKDNLKDHIMAWTAGLEMDRYDGI